MKLCALFAALLQLGIGKACDPSGWTACVPFNGDLQSCIQQDCCLWSNYDKACVPEMQPDKCPIEYFHHCSSLMPDCDSHDDTCGACSGDAMCSWRHDVASNTPSGYLWACFPTAHAWHKDPTTGQIVYDCNNIAPAPAPAPGPDPTPASGPDPAPAPAPGPDPTPAPGTRTTTAPGPDPTTPAPDPTPDPTPAPDTTPAPSAGIQIQSNVSSLCVDLPGGDTSNGALLWTWDCYGGETQQWSFQGGQLVYLPDPSKCVDLLGGDTTNGNRLGLWDCTQGESQLWGFDQDRGTIYLSVSKASDATKCVQIGGENKGDAVFIWDCTTTHLQAWTVGPQQSVPDPAPAPGPDPTPAPAPGPTPAPGNTTAAPSTGMQIQSTVSSLCVDLPGGDTSNGALLWTWDCYGGETQQWSFQGGQLVYLPDPSKCVDLLGGDTTNGNRLGLWDCTQGDSQLWGFDQDWGTIYLSVSKASDATKCAQIGGEHNGDPLVIWDCTVEPQQVWTVGSQQSLAVV